MEKKWEALTPEEKQEQRFAWWLAPKGHEFVSSEAKAAYEARVTRLKDAVQLRKTPDRIPVFPFYNFYPGYYAGYTPYEIMYDYDKLVDAWNKYVFDFEPDAYAGAFQPGSGKLFEIADYKMYNWPGHGISQQESYQCLEREYMKVEDYDALINDPTDFWLRVYLPRTFGAWQPLSALTPLIDNMELPMAGPSFIPFGLPEVQEGLRKLMAAGDEALRWAAALQLSDKTLIEGGFPSPLGGSAKAPFDVLGDTLRGTRAIMLDMYRCPDKILKACERLTPLMIRGAVDAANRSQMPWTFMPLHKGADGFMSDEQFKKFYWPTLREVIMGLVDEGIVPFLFAEGGYNSRLEIIRDLPKGTTIWLFDQTDMARAKEVLGDVACIAGNVPLSALQVGTVEETKAICQRLIDEAGKGGGFILGNGAVIDEAKAENLKAMIDYAKEHGVYS